MNYSVTGEQLTGIADAIRAKTGETDGLSFPTGFVEEIGTLKKVTYTNVTETFPSTDKTVSAGGFATLGSLSINSPASTDIRNLYTTTSEVYFERTSTNMKYTVVYRNKTNSSVTISANSVTVKYYLVEIS